MSTVRKTTGMALAACVARFQAEIEAVARAAIEDGEAPEGSVLNLDIQRPALCSWKVPEQATDG